MKNAVCVFATVLCLTACNKGPKVDLHNASGNQVVQAVKQSGVMTSGYMVEPGEWQSKVTIQDMQIPGMPAQFAARMKQEMAQHQQETSKNCLTPDEVKRPKEDFFAGEDKSCKYEHFAMGGGKMDIRMVCKREGSTQTTNMSGTYTPTSYSMDMSSTASGGAQQGMIMKMHVDADRIGECSAKG
jgi:hypothetical protein